MRGIFIEGKLVLAKIVKPSAKSDYEELRLSIDIGEMQNVIITAKPDFKVNQKVGEVISLPIDANSKSWDNVDKRFTYNRVSYYVRNEEK